jgi:hypothetical protein
MPPNRELAKQRHRKHANGYDASTYRVQPVRRHPLRQPPRSKRLT